MLLTNQNDHRDPRYYYLRVVNLKLNKQSEAKSELKSDKFLLKLQLGTKYSQTSFRIADFENEAKRKLINEEAHIFKYGAEEFLNVLLEENIEKGSKDKKDNQLTKSKIGARVSGYCRILLPPLTEYPHLCHQVNAQLIEVRNKVQITDKNIAELTLQIYYRLDFKGMIDIIPIAATLGRNVTSVGQMRPIIQLSIQNQTWQSLQAGGIHPHWSGHFHTKREKHPFRSLCSCITNVRNNIQLNRHNLEERQIYHLQNLTLKDTTQQKHEYFDIVRFTLASAGSYLSIKIYSNPWVGKEPQVVGAARIRIASASFFKYPTTADSAQFSPIQVDLFMMGQEEPEFVGKLSFDIRFIFDKQNVLNQGPYVSEMLKPQIEEYEEGQGQRTKGRVRV